MRHFVTKTANVHRFQGVVDICAAIVLVCQKSFAISAEFVVKKQFDRIRTWFPTEIQLRNMIIPFAEVLLRVLIVRSPQPLVVFDLVRHIRVLLFPDIVLCDREKPADFAAVRCIRSDPDKWRSETFDKVGPDLQ